MTALQSRVHEFHSESPAIQQGQGLAISGGECSKVQRSEVLALQQKRDSKPKRSDTHCGS